MTSINQVIQSEWLSRKEAAEYLGVSDKTLAIWACTGRVQIPYRKVGRLCKYKRADLDAFMESQEPRCQTA